jgi:hypothetical protein
LRKQGAEKNRTQPIIVRLTGRESEMDRQAVGVHDRVNLAGHPMYMELKETTDLAVWRKAMKKLLDAVEVSIKHSVKVADPDWHHSIESVLNHGRERVKGARTAPDLVAGLTATLIEVVFTQIGFMPTRARRDEMVPLKKEFWEMNNFRTVQYVQTSEQKEALEQYRAALGARKG